MLITGRMGDRRSTAASGTQRAANSSSVTVVVVRDVLVHRLKQSEKWAAKASRKRDQPNAM